MSQKSSADKKLNIIYFVGPERTRSLTIKLKTLYTLIAIFAAGVITFFALIAVATVQLQTIQYLEHRVVSLKEILFDYEVQFNDILEDSYDNDNILPLNDSPASTDDEQQADVDDSETQQNMPEFMDDEDQLNSESDDNEDLREIDRTGTNMEDPSAFEQMFTVSDLEFIEEDGQHRLEFKLNINTKPRRLYRGYLIVKSSFVNALGEEEISTIYPSGVQFKDGMIVNQRRGYFFRIMRFKTFKLSLKPLPNNKKYTYARFYVYSDNGKLVFEQTYDARYND